MRLSWQCIFLMICTCKYAFTSVHPVYSRPSVAPASPASLAAATSTTRVAPQVAKSLHSSRAKSPSASRTPKARNSSPKSKTRRASKAPKASTSRASTPPYVSPTTPPQNASSTINPTVSRTAKSAPRIGKHRSTSRKLSPSRTVTIIWPPGSRTVPAPIASRATGLVTAGLSVLVIFLLSARITIVPHASHATSLHATIAPFILTTDHLLASLAPLLSPFAQRDWPVDPGVLGLKNYSLFASLTSCLSPFSKRDWPSCLAILERSIFPVLPSPVSQSDFPSDPGLYKAYLCNFFNVSFTDVVDFTGCINRRRFIAAGISGEVWDALWIDPGDKSFIRDGVLSMVVVKLVRIPALREEELKDKRYKAIKRELELWSKLEHPNVLPLIGIARIEGDPNLPAFISPYMEKGNVMEFLKKNPSFPASRFVEDVIQGLHYLHTFDPVIIHGDIKGANVLVNHLDAAYLCDFGLSRFVADNTLWRTNSSCANGTLRWMAPELIRCDVGSPTIKSDIYAFGVTCYELLSGKPPFPLTNDYAVMNRVANGQRPPRESCHGDKMWSIITRCWAQKPEARPSTEETLKLVLQHTIPISRTVKIIGHKFTMIATVLDEHFYHRSTIRSSRDFHLTYDYRI